MPTNIPSANAIVSVDAERRILGPILPSAFATLESISSSGYLLFTRSNSCTIRKILSTPTASTRKGMTSAIIIVTLILSAENNPTDAETDISTMRIPLTPRVNFDCTKALAGFLTRDLYDKLADPSASDA